MADGSHHSDAVRVGDDGDCPRVLDRVEELALAVDDVGRDGDGPDPPAGEVADEVLGRRVEVDADPVSLCHAERGEPGADSVRLCPE